MKIASMVNNSRYAQKVLPLSFVPWWRTISSTKDQSVFGTPVPCSAMSVHNVVAIASSINLVLKQWALLVRISMLKSF